MCGRGWHAFCGRRGQRWRSIRHRRHSPGQARRRRDRRCGDSFAAGIDKLATPACGAWLAKNVAQAYIALCIREARRSPDFATPAFKRLLENARAIATSDRGRPLGRRPVSPRRSSDRSGRADGAKGMPQPTGAEVAKRVVEACRVRADLGRRGGFCSGAVIAGPLPAPFGQDTTYCSAVMRRAPPRKRQRL